MVEMANQVCEVPFQDRGWYPDSLPRSGVDASGGFWSGVGLVPGRCGAARLSVGAGLIADQEVHHVGHEIALVATPPAPSGGLWW